MNWGWRRKNLSQNVNQNVNAHPDFLQDIENIIPRSGNNLGQNVNATANANAMPDFMQDNENIISRRGNDAETGWNSRPMDFVRGITEEDNVLGGPSMYQYEQDTGFVQIKMLRNNTFVTVTDNKGNIKQIWLRRFLERHEIRAKAEATAEATAEVVGRRSRGLGLKSVVMKVNGFKRQAILS